MSTILTPRELALKHVDPNCADPILSIEADVPLQGEQIAVLKKMFASDKTIAGLEVFAPDGTSLGTVSRADMLAYILAQPSNVTRGGRIDQLEGAPVSNAPLFRCDAHQPPYQRLLWAASPQLLKCKVCGLTMQRAGSTL
jgi:hypothetical protein